MTDPRDEVIRRSIEAVVTGEFPEVTKCTAVVDLDRRTVDIICRTDGVAHGLQPTVTSTVVQAMPRRFKVHVEVFDSHSH